MTTSPDIRAAARLAPEKVGSESGRRSGFGDVLRKNKKGAGPRAAAPDAPPPLFEPPQQPMAARRDPRTDSAPASGVAPRIVDRILIGTSPTGAEARIRIGAGSLAGAEIRVSTVAGEIAVQAQLLTASAGSRQTLAVAIDRISRRLRARKQADPNAAGAPATHRAGKRGR